MPLHHPHDVARVGLVRKLISQFLGMNVVSDASNRPDRLFGLLFVEQEGSVGLLSEGHSLGSHPDHGVSLVLGVSQLHPLRSQV